MTLVHHLLPWPGLTVGSPSIAGLCFPSLLSRGWEEEVGCGWEQQHNCSEVLRAQTPLCVTEAPLFPSDLLSDEVTLLPVRSLTWEVKATELDLGLF